MGFRLSGLLLRNLLEVTIGWVLVNNRASLL